MKLRSLFFGTLCMLMLGVSFTSCSDDDDDSKKKKTMKVRRWNYLKTVSTF